MTWCPQHRGGRMPRKWKKRGVLARQARTIRTYGMEGVALFVSVGQQLWPAIIDVGNRFLGQSPTASDG